MPSVSRSGGSIEMLEGRTRTTMKAGRERGGGGSWPLVLALAVASANAGAQSPGWPQWGGPNRDFKTTATGLAATWPAGGPRELWSRPLGDGYSGIVVEGGTLYTMYRAVKGARGAQRAALTGAGPGPEVVAALDTATGKTV